MITLPETHVAELTPQGVQPISRRVKFKWLGGDMNYSEYGGKWFSNKMGKGRFDEDNVEADMCYVLELINMHEATGETEQDKYVVTISAVAPDVISDENIESAMQYQGIEDCKFEEQVWEVKVGIVYDYGISANIVNISGNNFNKLMREAKQEIQREEFLFGFSMDAPRNALGNTGWDFIKGETGFKYD